jgi:hypothetical protein
MIRSEQMGVNIPLQLAVACLMFVDLLAHTKPKNPELILLVGLPGAGKTTYYRDILKPLGYERISGHEQGKFDNCLRIADELLKGGKLVRLLPPRFCFASLFYRLIRAGGNW